MKVRAGVGLLGWPFPEKDPSCLWDFVDLCESTGVDSIWISDRIISPGLNLESMSFLAAVAGRTKCLKFGNSVLVLPLRNPTLLAKEIATLDFISGGRVLPAVGLGTGDPVEFEACGVSIKERAARTDEAIVLMRKLWTEDSVTFHGRYFHATNVHLEPRPVSSPCPPIWIGGRTDSAYRRTGRLGDGWLGSSMTPGEVKLTKETIQKYASEAGRTVPEDHFGVILPFYIGKNHDEALTRATEHAPQHRPEVRLQDYGAFGTPEDIIQRVMEFVSAGATKFVMRAACAPSETLSQTELVARDVIQVLHGTSAG
jgi:probable F420-dependent oxidoreductase